MTLEEIIAELRARPSQTVPFTGEALGDMKRGAAYAAAAAGTLGVPVFWSGGKLRTASIAIAKVLGIEDKVAAKSEQQGEIAPPLAGIAPAPKPARSRKPPLREAAAHRPSKSESAGIA
jgi:hypothetical protein